MLGRFGRLSRPAVAACVLAWHPWGLVPEGAENSGKPRIEAVDEQRIELLDDFETLWANRTTPDEDEYALWVRAVTPREARPLSTCAFTMWDARADHEWREARFDPNREPPWQLVSVGGRAPTEEELAKFEGRSKTPIETAPAQFTEDGEAIAREGLAVLHRTDDFVIFGAKPHTLDGASRTVRRMQPLFMTVVSRDDARIRVVDMRSTRPFSVMFGVRVSFMHSRVVYEHNDAVNDVVVKYREVTMRGRAFAVAKFAVDEFAWYDDISCDRDAGGE